MTVVDDCTRECLALIADTSLSGARVARELATLFDTRGKPQTVVSDNGTPNEAEEAFYAVLNNVEKAA